MKKIFLEISQNWQENTCCRVSFLPAALLKKRLRNRCFPVNFAKLLRTPLFTEHLRWLLLYNKNYNSTRCILIPCDKVSVQSHVINILHWQKLLVCSNIFFMVTYCNANKCCFVNNLNRKLFLFLYPSLQILAYLAHDIFFFLLIRNFYTLSHLGNLHEPCQVHESVYFKIK